MNFWQWFRFFRLYGNGWRASFHKARLIRRAGVRVSPIYPKG